MSSPTVAGIPPPPPQPAVALPQLHNLDRRAFDAAPGMVLVLHQDLAASRALRPLLDAAEPGDEALLQPGEPSSGLDCVGFVAWQCGLLLAEFLLRRPPFRQWQDVRVLDLGAGTGVVGIALALAGADVVLADLPHVTPLTRMNVEANCDPARHRASVVDYAWGAAPLPPALAEGPAFDVIVGADLVYDPACYAALRSALGALAAPHTLVFLAIKRRGRGEDAFVEALGAEGGFAVVEVPAAQLGEDYREEGATYCVVRAAKLD